MIYLQQFRPFYICAVICAAVTFAASVARGEVSTTRVGSPSFDLFDIHLYTAPANGSFQALLPQHFPRVPHSNFGQEFSNGLANTGYAQKSVYTLADFSNPNAVHLSYTLVPNQGAPSGKTPDFENGPILSNGVNPLVVSAIGDVYLNGDLFEGGPGAFVVNIPRDDAFDGYSHLHLNHWENNTFARPGLTSLTGDYEYRLIVRDANNMGYDVTARFSVVPEPAAGVSVLIGLIGATGFLRRKLRLVSTQT